MVIGAIIAEYNPFHNGHAYQIQQLRLAGATHVVVMMSGNFVQRGGPALFEKRVRTAAALCGGADLVLELPLPYAMATAERFAFGAVGCIRLCGCVDLLHFGSECGSIPLLCQAADALVSPGFTEKMAPFLSQGLPFASARAKALEAAFGADVADILAEPNNTLAVEYICQLRQLAPTIQPATVQRLAAQHHSSTPSGSFASATFLRSCLMQGQPLSDIEPFVPAAAVKQYAAAPMADVALGQRALLARLRRLSPAEYSALPDLSEGIENRLQAAVARGTCLEEILSLAKTKRYSMARLRRLVFAAYLGLSGDLCRQMPPYLRVLGHNEHGRQVLAKMRTTAAVPVSHSLAKLSKASPAAAAFAQAEASSCDLYDLFCPQLHPCGWDYTTPPVILTTSENKN